MMRIAVVVVGIAHAAEHHRAQAVRADLDAGLAQCAVLHSRVPFSVGGRPMRPSCCAWQERLRHHGIVSLSQRVNLPVGPS